jgi:Tfp pilus assembly protein PilZ
MPSNEFDVIKQIIKLVKRMSPDDQQHLLLELEQRIAQNKRGHNRKSYFMVVDYATQDRMHIDFIKDISESGVFIRTHMPLKIGQEVSLTFPFPDHKKHIKIGGKIVRTTEEGIGIEFIMTDDGEQKKLIRSLLDMISNK